MGEVDVVAAGHQRVEIVAPTGAALWKADPHRAGLARAKSHEVLRQRLSG